VAADEEIEHRLASTMPPIARQLATKRSFWLTAAVLFGLFCSADYHYSVVNQIPSDGPLRIGYPMTGYWMVCPMIAVGSAACQSGMSALGLIVDALFCVALACVAARIAIHVARLDCVKRKRFWVITSLVFVLAFPLVSLVTALHSASHHGRAIEIGFPAVYLYEYAGDSFRALNFIVDLVLCYALSLLCVAVLFGARRADTR
jgi:hypothetical protein